MDKSLILSKIKSHYDFKKDSDFAVFLGVTSQVLSNWRKRNTYDANLIYTKCEKINPHWLLTGKGEMLNIIDVKQKDENLDSMMAFQDKLIKAFHDNESMKDSVIKSLEMTIKSQSKLIKSIESQLLEVKRQLVTTDRARNVG